MTATETWTGTDGAAWPAQWTTTGTASIQGNKGRLITGAHYSNASALLSGMAAYADADLTVDITPSSAGTAMNLVVSTTVTGVNAPWPVTGYAMRLQYAANGNVNGQLFRWSNQASAGQGAFSKTGVGFTDPWRLRMQVTAGVVRAKFWLASATEPASWDVTYTDPSPLAAGKILLAMETAGIGPVGADFDNLTDTAGAPADTTAPTVPGTPTATAGQASASVAFAASTDAVGVTGYRVFSSADGYTTAVATGSASPIVVSGLTNGTAYTFKVAAYDAAGNTSAQSAASNSVTPSATAGVIAPNDPNIIYSPYNWTVAAGVAQTASSGAYLRTVIAGSATAVTATFDRTGATGTQTVAIYVDGALASTVNLAATVNIPLSGQGWSKHIVELVFRGMSGTDLWTNPTGGVKFTGFTTTPTAAASAPSRRRPLNVLCLGDSIANGYLAGAVGIDARFGWALPLRDLLGAEVGVSAYNGQGWNNPGDGNVPVFTTTYDKVYGGAARSFTSPAEPALVLINMGTNDNTDVTAAATTVLNGVLAATTATKVVLILPFIGTARKAALQAAVAACSAPARASFLDTTGWLAAADTIDGTHPLGYINLADLSPRIAAAVQPLISGSGFTPKRFLRRAGAWVPVG